MFREGLLEEPTSILQGLYHLLFSQNFPLFWAHCLFSPKRNYIRTIFLSWTNALIFWLIYGTRFLLWLLVYILWLVLLFFPTPFLLFPVHQSHIHTHLHLRPVKTRTIDFIFVSTTKALKIVCTPYIFINYVLLHHFLKYFLKSPELCVYIKDFATLSFLCKHTEKLINQRHGY